jgi:hypothetical protein
MLSAFLYAANIPLDQAQRAATDRISKFYPDNWIPSTNLTYFSEQDNIVAYGFVFTNSLSTALDDKYKTTTTATFETYTNSDEPIVLKVYKGLPDVILWQKNIPDTMLFDKYIMISPMVTAIALSSNSASYYLSNTTLKKIQVDTNKNTTLSVLDDVSVLPNEKYKKMAADAWERYEK